MQAADWTASRLVAIETNQRLLLRKPLN